MTQWSNGFNAGRQEARAELGPLVAAIRDAIFMFKQIEEAHKIPLVDAQYVAMGKQLERLLIMSGLEDDEG